MPRWDYNLAGVHLDIARDPGTRIHVLAGPGTGKTFAMMRRIARLLEEGVEPGRILACSFTRTAARDLREQLARLDLPGVDEVRATTLHALCFSILGSQQAFEFTRRTPRPLLSYEIDCLNADLADMFNGIRNTKRLVQAYEAAWARMQRDEPGYALAEEDGRFERELVSWLRFHESMLIGELVPLTYHFLRSNPARDAIPHFEHVLVDEYQDLNKTDQTLVKRLAEGSSLLVIGDDNQSIYRFRHANPEGIRAFPNDVPGTTPYIIEESKRCPPNIVDISNALISHDPHTTRPTPLKSVPGEPSSTIWVVQHDTLEDEVDGIADFVDKYLTDHPDLPAGRVLILTPRRFIGNAIKDALICRRRNALSYFQEDALSSYEAARGFCLLTLLANHSDRAALRAWFGLGTQDCRTAAMRRIRDHCEHNNKDFRVVLEELASGRIRIPFTSRIIERWRDLQNKIASLSDQTGLPLVHALWPETGGSVSDIRLLAESISLRSPNADELLDELRTAITQPELPGSDADIIQVMSLHKSKGLTRDLVIVAGCMAGVLPSLDDDDPVEVRNADLEEQRRLFYVALTRSSDTLVISSSAKLRFGDAKRGRAEVLRTIRLNGVMYAVTAFTPFLSELGPALPNPLRGNDWRKRVGL